MTTSLVLILPIYFIETILYIFSIVNAKKRCEKLNYRLVRANIQTPEQNNKMWSTDDEFKYVGEEDDSIDDGLSNLDANMRELYVVDGDTDSYKSLTMDHVRSANFALTASAVQEQYEIMIHNWKHG